MKLTPASLRPSMMRAGGRLVGRAAEIHRAEAERRDAQPAAAKIAVLHAPGTAVSRGSLPAAGKPTGLQRGTPISPAMTEHRPTLAAPDDDPYLWLEEVDGERATAWVDAQTHAHARPLRRRALRGRPRRAARRCWTAPTTCRSRPGAAACSTISGAMPPSRAACGAGRPWTRSAPRRPTGTSCSTSTRWRRPRARTGSGTAQHAAAGARARRAPPFARRQRRGRAARVRPRTPRVRRRRLRPAGGQGRRGWLDARYAAAHRALAGATSVRLRAHRAALAAGRGTGRRRGPLFETDPATWPPGAATTAIGDRLIFVEQTGFFDATVWLGDRTGPKQRVELPSDARYQWEDDWLAVAAADGVAGRWPRPRARHGRRHRLDAFLAGDRDFTTVFEPGQRRALQGFFWSSGPPDPQRARRSAAACSSADARQTGRRTASPACRELGTVSRLAARHRGRGERRHPARQRAGPGDAADPAADPPGSGRARGAQAAAAGLRRDRAWS